MGKIESKEQLINEIAEAIQEHFDEQSFFLDLTTQTITFLPSACLDDDFDDEDYENDDEDDEDYEDDADPITGIPYDESREELSHELVEIEPSSSRDDYEIMEAFAAQENNEYLFHALRRRHPFHAFRDAVERTDFLQKWYDFRNGEYNRLAKRWLEENGIDFVDGKVVRIESDDFGASEDEQ